MPPSRPRSPASTCQGFGGSCWGNSRANPAHPFLPSPLHSRFGIPILPAGTPSATIGAGEREIKTGFHLVGAFCCLDSGLLGDAASPSPSPSPKTFFHQTTLAFSFSCPKTRLSPAASSNPSPPSSLLVPRAGLCPPAPPFPGAGKHHSSGAPRPAGLPLAAALIKAASGRRSINSGRIQLHQTGRRRRAPACRGRGLPRTCSSPRPGPEAGAEPPEGQEPLVGGSGCCGVPRGDGVTRRLAWLPFR